MTPVELTAEQQAWRDRVLSRAYNRETEDCEKENARRLEIRKRWSAAKERAETLAGKLAHLEGIPVRYDEGKGAVRIEVQEKPIESLLEGEDGERPEEPAPGYETHCVRVNAVTAKGRVYHVLYAGVTYQEAKVILLQRAVKDEAVVEAAEQWVEEHAYGTA